MDNRVMSIWYLKVFKPYVASYGRHSGLLLYGFKCHKSQELQDALDSDNSSLYMVPPHYSGILQPCPVGINKPLKDKLKKASADSRRRNHSQLKPRQKIGSPKRIDVQSWIKIIWDEFSVETVQNSLKGCSYVFEEGSDYNKDTESEANSDNELVN